MPARYVRKNRRFWDREAAEYQGKHGDRLTETARAWGVWRIPEADLGVLGDVRGRDVLELGCGGGQWSIALAGQGARAVGIDLSRKQLEHARRAVRRGDVPLPLVQASAEELPFRAAAFDLVFCDHGAVGFADPRLAVPEAARVLRSGGLLAFSISSPMYFMCWNPTTERVDGRLHADYWDMRSEDDEDAVVFQLPYGEWIELFTGNDLRVERLVQLRPSEQATTTYQDFVSRRWARRWPAEDLWVVRKTAG